MRYEKYVPYDPNAPVTTVRAASKKEYRKICTNPQYQKELRNSAILCYVLVGVQVLVTLFMNIYAIFDVAVLLGLTLGMHLGKRKGCAIAIMVYSIVSVVISLMISGKLTGWMWIVAGIAALKAFSVADNEYEAGGSL